MKIIEKMSQNSIGEGEFWGGFLTFYFILFYFVLFWKEG
jgi:hypothetical protein